MKLVDTHMLGFRPELENYPMIVTKTHSCLLGFMITVSTEHGISVWNQESLEAVNESR